MGGGYFPFFTENRPQKHKKHAILHTSQANGGGGLEPPRPPGYATGYIPPISPGFRNSCIQGINYVTIGCGLILDSAIKVIVKTMLQPSQTTLPTVLF